MAVKQRRVEDTFRHQASHDRLTGLPNHPVWGSTFPHWLRHIGMENCWLWFWFRSLQDDQRYAGSCCRGWVIATCCSTTSRLPAWRWYHCPLGRRWILFYYSNYLCRGCCGLAQIILTSFKTPFRINDHELHTTSIGIALAPMTVKTLKLCWRMQTQAYRAKQQGRQQLYTPEMNTKALEQLVLANSLYKALNRDEFLLQYQPQVDLNWSDCGDGSFNSLAASWAGLGIQISLFHWQKLGW